MTPENKEKLFTAYCHPQTHAIIAAMLDREPNTTARYVGKATITSDGFCMCSFVGADGIGHSNAFVGSWEEVEDNLQLVAEDLSIPEDETRELVRNWIAQDYRPHNHMKGALGL
jgi:hypothetical protein